MAALLTSLLEGLNNRFIKASNFLTPYGEKIAVVRDISTKTGVSEGALITSVSTILVGLIIFIQGW